MSPVDQILKAATTCDSVLNTWREQRDPSEACRLDYALIDDSKLTPISASVEFTEKIPGIGSYSDHFAYTATFQVLPKFIQCERDPASASEKLKVYNDFSALVINYIRTTNKWQYQWRMSHFLVSMFVCIGLVPVITVASLVVPWLTSGFYLAGLFIGIAGAINGLIGYLFTKGEYRSLREVIFQINDRYTYLKTTAKFAQI
ncbi:unnamed protein product [Ambrosiozyma monospora]|uniref:Unnamed protein product n=1 Tax=Ambrosiozyma monospora TaxID=43982 RepID=A0ACB5TZ71_AMBMO|nr:unnamed protein product [Ambrosiozyma monospora]